MREVSGRPLSSRTTPLSGAVRPDPSSRPSAKDQLHDLGLIVLVSPPTQCNVVVVLPERDIRPVLFGIEPSTGR